jgi:hypothetical protein
MIKVILFKKQESLKDFMINNNQNSQTVAPALSILELRVMHNYEKKLNIDVK